MSFTSDDLGDIKQLMESLLSAQDKRLEIKFDAIDKRFEAIDKRFEAVDARFDVVDARFDEQDVKLDTIMNAFGADIDDHTDRLENHEVRIVRLEKRPA